MFTSIMLLLGLSAYGSMIFIMAYYWPYFTCAFTLGVAVALAIHTLLLFNWLLFAVICGVMVFVGILLEK